jgi:putative sterol carrier protein
MEEMDVRSIMTKIPDYFIPEKAKGITAKILCLFSGEQGSNWVITIEDQECKVYEGIVNDPDITIRAKAETGVKLLTGEIDPMRAFLLGKVKVSGDMTLGMKLVDFFNRP